jgi:hypothetical protein
MGVQLKAATVVVAGELSDPLAVAKQTHFKSAYRLPLRILGLGPR